MYENKKEFYDLVTDPDPGRPDFDREKPGKGPEKVCIGVTHFFFYFFTFTIALSYIIL